MEDFMMKNIVLIGGNGYIGQEVLRQWLEQDVDARFYVISRSGKSRIVNERVVNLSADFTEKDLELSGLPSQIDYMVDFVGRPENDKDLLRKVNEVPVDNMIKLAEKYQVPTLGYIGGVLGPKSFTNVKKEMIRKLENTGKNIAYVEPTVVYGGGRKDALSKMVPLFKFFGLFSKNMKPVTVDMVASELIQKLTSF